MDWAGYLQAMAVCALSVMFGGWLEMTAVDADGGGDGHGGWTWIGYLELPSTLRRCYHCDIARALYRATVSFDFTPDYLLCVDCAATLREYGDIIEISTLPTSASG